MPSGRNKMNNKSYEQLLITQATIESSGQDSDEKMNNLTGYPTAMITSIMDHIKMSKSSPDQKESPKAQDPNTVARLTRLIHHWKVDIIRKLVACGLSNTRSDHQSSMNSRSRQNSKATLIWTLRTSTIHINMCLNTVNRLREDLLSSYQSIKRHSEFEE